MIQFRKYNVSKNVIWFFIAIFFALIAPGLGYIDGLSFEAQKTLFILVLAIGLWVSDAIPAFAVSLMIVGFQILFLGSDEFTAGSSLALEKYTKAWASPVIWLLMGGFFLSLSFTMTGLDKDIFRILIQKFGNKTRNFILGIMLSTAFLSMFISNTASTALVIAILMPILMNESYDDSIRKILLIGVPAAASIGGIGTLIGSTPNAIAHSYLAEQGIYLEFFSWAYYGLPIVFILLFLIWGALIYIYKPRSTISFKLEPVSASVFYSDQIRMKKIIVIISFVLTLALWISAPLHSLSISVISFLPIVLLTVTGVIKSADIRNLPWDTLILIMGGMSLGDSVVESGLAMYLIEFINIEGYQFMVVSLLFAYISVFMSNFMSNTAAAAIIIPMASGLIPGKEMSMALTIAMSASLATLLPVSTPPNAISYATRLINSSDFLKVGLILSIIGPILVVLILNFWLK